MIYLTLGEAIKQGLRLYSDIHDNKPPLIYVTAAISGNLFWFKTILALWSLGTIYVFWRLTETLYPKNNKLQKTACIVFAVITTTPIFEGQIANAENFMIGPIILAFYMLIKQKNTSFNLLAAGSLLSMATLYKIPAAFDVLAIIFYWLYSQKRINLASLTKLFGKTSILAAGFIIPITITFIFSYTNHSLQDYFSAAFLQNIGYLSSWRSGVNENVTTFQKNFPLLLRLAFLILLGVVLFWKRKLSKKFTFISFWLFLTLFAATLSERPYPHYLLQSSAPISILLANIFATKNKEQAYSILPLLFVFLVLYQFKFWYYNPIEYYTSFAKLVTHKATNSEYLKSFGNEVERNYIISKYIAKLTDPKDRVFVWGDSAPIYALSKRLPPIKYVAGYHIKDFSSEQEVLDKLNQQKPTLIVVLPDSDPPESLSFFIKSNYALLMSIEGSQIYKLLDDKIRSLIFY